MWAFSFQLKFFGLENEALQSCTAPAWPLGLCAAGRRPAFLFYPSAIPPAYALSCPVPPLECALCVYSGGDDWGSGDRRHRRTPGAQVPIFGPFASSPATIIHQVPPPLLFRSCCAKPSAQTLTYKLFFIPI